MLEVVVVQGWMRKGAALAVAALLLAGAGWGRAQEEDAGKTTTGAIPIKDEVTPEQRRAVERGLKWLAQSQGPDGGYGDSCFTALAGLAFMADGNMPEQGPYGKNLGKAVDFVLKNAQESGLLTTGDMYGHGFATLFLAEAYGTTARADVKEKLQNAVRLIVQCQNPQGGWRYQPAPTDADISVTICQVMALRAARNAGITVPKTTIDKALEYVRKSQCPDGGFMYTLGGGGSAFPRSAAGVAILYYAGDYGSKEIASGINYLKRQVPGKGENANSGHTFYGNYYGTQAMFMAGGDSWQQWWPAEREMLIKRQGANGSWQGEASEQYATAMALIILQVPNRLLPILQK